MKRSTLFTFAIFSIFILSCKEIGTAPEAVEPQLPEEPYVYTNIDIPWDMLDTLNNPFVAASLRIIMDENPKVTDWGATLGRVLFYDKKLSLNNAISCASCHKQENAFADPVAHSVGFENRITPRNSMAIINPVTLDKLFWDLRAENALDLTLQPVQNHIEMGIENLQDLAFKLREVSYYPPLFKKAFGTEVITVERISEALAQFLCSMTSFQSKYDKALQMKDDFASLSPLELAGKKLFFSNRLKCAVCHQGINFAAPISSNFYYSSNNATANIGLDLTNEDKGTSGKFRIPILRNVALTAPYMHDGRFATLDEVLEHYSTGIKANKHLSRTFRNADGSPVKLNLTEVEKEALKAFLGTLTDDHFITDKKYSNPFK